MNSEARQTRTGRTSADFVVIMSRAFAIFAATVQLIHGVGVSAKVYQQSQDTRVPFLPDSAQNYVLSEHHWTVMLGPIADSAVYAILVLAVVEIMVRLMRMAKNKETSTNNASATSATHGESSTE